MSDPPIRYENFNKSALSQTIVGGSHPWNKGRTLGWPEISVCTVFGAFHLDMHMYLL
jgi:hypothetical protein